MFFFFPFFVDSSQFSFATFVCVASLFLLGFLSITSYVCNALHCITWGVVWGIVRQWVKLFRAGMSIKCFVFLAENFDFCQWEIACYTHYHITPLPFSHEKNLCSPRCHFSFLWYLFIYFFYILWNSVRGRCLVSIINCTGIQYFFFIFVI